MGSIKGQKPDLLSGMLPSSRLTPVKEIGKGGIIFPDEDFFNPAVFHLIFILADLTDNIKTLLAIFNDRVPSSQSANCGPALCAPA